MSSNILKQERINTQPGVHFYTPLLPSSAGGSKVFMQHLSKCNIYFLGKVRRVPQAIARISWILIYLDKLMSSFVVLNNSSSFMLQTLFDETRGKNENKKKMNNFIKIAGSEKYKKCTITYISFTHHHYLFYLMILCAWNGIIIVHLVKFFPSISFNKILFFWTSDKDGDRGNLGDEYTNRDEDL